VVLLSTVALAGFSRQHGWGRVAAALLALITPMARVAAASMIVDL
jgi:hypothetical protein